MAYGEVYVETFYLNNPDDKYRYEQILNQAARGELKITRDEFVYSKGKTTDPIITVWFRMST